MTGSSRPTKRMQSIPRTIRMVFLARPFGLATFLMPLLMLQAMPAMAQIDLPNGNGQGKPQVKDPAPAGVVPHLECLTCQAANYVTTIEPAADEGKQKAWCLTCRNVRLFRRIDPAAARKGSGLDFPVPSPTAQPGQTPPANPQPANPVGSPAASQSVSDAALSAATSIFEDVRRMRKPDPSLLHSASEGLLALGDSGLLKARMTLSSSQENELIVATRALLIGARGEDAGLVTRRLQQPLPPRASARLIRQVIELNPVAANPRWLASLLDHPQKPARVTAFQELERLALLPGTQTKDWLAFLQPLMAGKNTDGRYRALSLIGQLPDTDVLHPVLEALSDPRWKVARKAVDILEGWQDPRIDDELMTRAFGSRWILRENAYALLAIVEREDKSLKPILHKGHVEALLRAMDMNDEMVHNTAALALAGVGFRQEDSQDSAWLDRGVMDRLVSVVAAVTFFSDRTSLVEPCMRRLQLLSGRNYGMDGPRWAEWWLANRHSFRASRASMVYGPNDLESMSAFYVDRRDGAEFELLGPEQLFRPQETVEHERYYLTREQASDLLRLLEEQGALGAAQPPGPRGSDAQRGQELVLRLGAGAKSFSFGPNVKEAWLESIAQSMRSLREQCAWQDFFQVAEHQDKRAWVLGVWQNEEVPTTQPERNDWLRGVYLAWVEAGPLGKRQSGLQRLMQLGVEGSGPVPADLNQLLALLSQERSLGTDASLLFELALQATALEAGTLPSPEQALAGERLIGTVLERFARQGIVPISRVLIKQGPKRVLLACKENEPLLRAAGGLVLIDSERTAENWAILYGLLEDEDPLVATTLLSAVGSAKIPEALEVCLRRAAGGNPVVRKGALRALGKLGGPRAMDALKLALTEPSGQFRLAAAEGLADLRNVQAAPLMVALLRNGREQGIQGALRRGLTDLGPQAHEFLVGALNSPHPFTRREASLLLGTQDVPEAARELMRLLSEDPTDSEVARCLVGLTCVDYTTADDRDGLWWSWWDNVRQGDAFPWFLTACATRGLPSPQPIDDHFYRNRGQVPGAGQVPQAQTALGGLSADGAAYLLQAMRFPETWLAQRAWREWNRRVPSPLKAMPDIPDERVQWVNRLAESLSEER